MILKFNFKVNFDKQNYITVNERPKRKIQYKDLEISS